MKLIQGRVPIAALPRIEGLVVRLENFEHGFIFDSWFGKPACDHSVNGEDVTQGTPTADGLFRFNFVFNNNKGQSSPQPMAGDIAAVIVYSDVLSGNEKQQVRDYLNRTYSLWEHSE